MRKVSMIVVLFAVMVVVVVAVTAEPKPQENFRANLSGANEVPPVETNAQGVATFKLSPDGTEMSYKLIVANIDDVAAAHIHIGFPGEVNPPVVTLYPGPLISGPFNGVLATGTFAVDAGLLARMRAGNTYVNVHTSANAGGEIRGQIH